MRSHRYWCAIFSASLGSLLSLMTAASLAQQMPPMPGAQPGDLPGTMPSAMPSALSSAMPSAVPGASNNNDAVRPANFNAFSNAGGPMAATEVQPYTRAQLRDANSIGQRQNPYPNNAYPNYPGYAGQAQMRNTAMQQPVYPQGNYPQGNYPPGYYPQGNYQQAPYPQPGAGQAQLVNDPLNNPAAAQPGAFPVPVVAGDPRYVSPPPRPGKYATVPYQAPFRTVSYQLPQQSPMQQPVQPPSVLANQPQSVPNTTALPQYQPTVGQLASYQALQPGYCAPTIPSNGVPAFVPGAVAPPTLPPNLTPQLYTPDNAGYRPLFSLGQENYNVQLGRGIIGQPTVYVAGQPIRNFMRYIFP